MADEFPIPKRVLECLLRLPYFSEKWWSCLIMQSSEILRLCDRGLEHVQTLRSMPRQDYMAVSCYDRRLAAKGLIAAAWYWKLCQEARPTPGLVVLSCRNYRFWTMFVVF